MCLRMNRRESEEHAAAVRIQMGCPLSDQIGKINQLITADRYLCNITVDQVLDIHALSLSLFHIILAEIIFKPL